MGYGGWGDNPQMRMEVILLRSMIDVCNGLVYLICIDSIIMTVFRKRYSDVMRSGWLILRFIPLI